MSERPIQTPAEQIEAIVNVPVATARSNVKRAIEVCEKALDGLPIEQANAVFSVVQSMLQLRNQTMQGAMTDHQSVEREKARRAQAEAEKAAADANKPQLVGVAGGSLQ